MMLKQFRILVDAGDNRLVQELLAHGLTYTETLRSNKPQIPSEMKADSRRQEFSSIFAFHDQLSPLSHTCQSQEG